MNDLYLADYHVHSDFSEDAVMDMEDIIKEAIALGLNEICFTDHVDYGIKRDYDDPRGFEYIIYNGEKFCMSNVDYVRYVPKIKELSYKYQGQINIKMGMEFGIQTHTIEKYQELFNKYPFDFIIMSVHQADDKQFWNQDYQKNKTQDEYNQGYYKEILNVIKEYKNYSVLGHLDHIARYDLEGKYPFSKIKDIIKEILEIVIKDNKGIEINTSSFRYGLDDLTPSLDILKLYHDLGGRIITIGSDHHKSGHLASNFKEVINTLKEIGFKEYCTFDKMKPIFHKL